MTQLAAQGGAGKESHPEDAKGCSSDRALPLLSHRLKGLNMHSKPFPRQPGALVYPRQPPSSTTTRPFMIIGRIRQTRRLARVARPSPSPSGWLSALTLTAQREWELVLSSS
eukprot:COSAG01_NODE_7586_length_3138_cov_1.997697_1_plen_112_part_00